MEITVGVLKKLRDDQVQGKLLETWSHSIQAEFRHRTISFDSDCASVTAPLWLLRPRGNVDSMIAGTALSHRLTLVTRNVGDFSDIPDLKIINPWSELLPR